MKKHGIQIRNAIGDDRSFWFSLDKHLAENEFDKKIRDKPCYVILHDGVKIGILRYNLFWDNLPFCTLLYVDRPYQNKGYGSKLMAHWEDEMKSAGHTLVLVSTQSDESARYFYRKIGYVECGSLNLPTESTELFLYKNI